METNICKNKMYHLPYFLKIVLIGKQNLNKTHICMEITFRDAMRNIKFNEIWIALELLKIS